ncbi:hypothetical protein U5N28_00820 [Lysinibacillus telephonicus]|uniref:Uncharacterized protein n=1 Tax=Lysinibacillus telephonicus TaxID=1714840 RepID=A0A431UGY0_9BACI|nr:hypothetical protein [Lysinibacillus telephonicus]RTQ88924.1 hypothetical protein EKG35_17305 [Lysinibacillus telephonicus]
MKRWGILVLLIIVIPLFLNGNRQTVLIKLYAEEWGIHIPIPKDSEELWGSEASFNGDGEWINVFSYGTELNLINSGMKLITEESVSKVNSQIKNFIQTTILLYRDEKLTKNLNRFKLKRKWVIIIFINQKITEMIIL